MKRYSTVILQLLFLLNGLMWMVFSIVGILKATNGVVGMLGVWLLAILMAVNGMLFLLCSMLVRKGGQLYFYAALAFLFVNIVLSVTDQIGFLDWFTMLIDVALAALLIVNRKAYLSGG